MASSSEYNKLPDVTLEKLKELEDELEDGYITQKGYDKKRKCLLEKFRALPSELVASGSPRSQSPDDSIIEDLEAIDEDISINFRKFALNAAMQDQRASGPISSKRSVPIIRPTDAPQQTDQAKSINSFSGLPPVTSPKPRLTHSSVQDIQSDNEDSTIRISNLGENLSSDKESSRLKQVSFGEDIVRSSHDIKTGGGIISDKIQALLTTLSRPNKIVSFPIISDLEDDFPTKEDPTAPRAVGTIMQPAVGNNSDLIGDSPSLDEQLVKHAKVLKKFPAVSCLDSHGKPTLTLTYEKFFQKVCRVGFTILHKTSGLNEGDRIALVFSSGEPINVAVAFYGSISVNFIPLLIDPPISRDDPGGSQVGFLLGSIGITHALTSETTLRSLPRDDSGHLRNIKGWPKIQWITIESTNKPTRDFKFPSKLDIDSPAYIESSIDREGAVLGVSISHYSILTHTRILIQSCRYTKEEVVICTEDVKRSLGFWHGILACIYTGMHVVFVQPALLNSFPLIWLHMVHKFDASCVIFSSRVINSVITQAQATELRYMTLDRVRIFLLRDAQNPWSLGSCDAFVEAFKSKGVKPESLVLCAYSPETLTISIRQCQNISSARGVMSIHGLSYGIVRVEEEGSYTSLTLQDVGHVIPNARVSVVKISGKPYLCKTDEIGELCLSSATCGTEYWGLKGKSLNTFQVRLVDSKQDFIGTGTYVRSGLLGFIGAGGLVFVCGSMDGLILSSGRRHNREDISATVLAVDPPRFAYKNRVAVFSVPILKDERVIAIAEVRNDAHDDVAFRWMNTVVSAVDTIHGISIFGVLLVRLNSLPKVRGYVHIPETRTQFLDGTLLLEHLLLCPHQCIINLPILKKGSDRLKPSPFIGDLVKSSKAFLNGQIVSPNREIPKNFNSIGEILEWRGINNSDRPLFSFVDVKGKVNLGLTAGQLFKKAEKVGAFLLDRGKLTSGQIITLLLPSGLDLIVGFYASILVGLIPLVIRNITYSNYQSLLPTIKHILKRSKCSAILTIHSTIKLLKSKDVTALYEYKNWPLILDIEDIGRKKLDKIYHPPTSELIAFIDYTISATGVLTGTKLSHQNSLNFCRAHQQTCELGVNHTSVIVLEPSSGLGLLIYMLSSIYSGHHSIIIHLNEFEQNPSIWFSVLSQYNSNDTYCTYSVIDRCLKELSNSIQSLKTKSINLSNLNSLVIVAEERPRLTLLIPFSIVFAPLGLNSQIISTSFGCRVNPAICLRGPKQPCTMHLYLDARALKLDQINIVERGVPHALLLGSSGRILPGVTVIIVNTLSRSQVNDGELGEIWVESEHNSIGFDGMEEDIAGKIYNEHFEANLIGTENTDRSFARTGYLGLILRSDEEEEGVTIKHLFVVGSIEGSLNLDSVRYYPEDLENTVNRCSKFINGSAVFEGDHLLVVVAELDTEDRDPLNIVPKITTALIEEHYVIPGVVVITDPRTIPINSRGEIQRLHLKDSFLNDQLDPVYVAYNL